MCRPSVKLNNGATCAGRSWRRRTDFFSLHPSFLPSSPLLRHRRSSAGPSSYPTLSVPLSNASVALLAPQDFNADEAADALDQAQHGEYEVVESGEKADGAEKHDKANEERVTTPYMTKYERARILGTRALQISCVFLFLLFVPFSAS